MAKPSGHKAKTKSKESTMVGGAGERTGGGRRVTGSMDECAEHITYMYEIIQRVI